MSADLRQLTIYQVIQQTLDITERKHRGAETSVAAHKKIVNRKLEMYDVILNFYKVAGPSTSHEVVAGTGLKLQTVSARLSELRHRLGKLRDSGIRRGGAAVLEIV